MRAAVALALALALAGCASSARRVMAPDGYQAIYVTCRRSQLNCMERAAQECPGGYRVLDSSERSGAVVMDHGNGVASVTSTHRGTLVIRCRHDGE